MDADAPAWAAETSHPDRWNPRTTEFSREVAAVEATDFGETVAVRLVQNGPGAPEQVQVSGLRFTVDEAVELAEGVVAGIRWLHGLPTLSAGFLAPLLTPAGIARFPQPGG